VKNLRGDERDRDREREREREREWERERMRDAEWLRESESERKKYSSGMKNIKNYFHFYVTEKQIKY